MLLRWMLGGGSWSGMRKGSAAGTTGSRVRLQKQMESRGGLWCPGKISRMVCAQAGGRVHGATDRFHISATSASARQQKCLRRSEINFGNDIESFRNRETFFAFASLPVQDTRAGEPLREIAMARVEIWQEVGGARACATYGTSACGRMCIPYSALRYCSSGLQYRVVDPL